MAKRFSSTEIWDEDWFIDMDPEYKLFWYYMLSTCNHAGLFKVNVRTFSSINGVKIAPSKALTLFNVDKQRIRVITSTLWLIEDFFVFQYGNKFNPKNRVHESIEKIYSRKGISMDSIRGLEGAWKGLSSPMVEDNDGVKDKDSYLKDKEYKGVYTEDVQYISGIKNTDNTIQNTRVKKNIDEEPVLNKEELISEIKTESIENPNQNSPPLIDRSFNPNIGEDGKFKIDAPPKQRPKQFTTALTMPWDTEKFKQQWEVWKDYLHERNPHDYPYRGNHGEQAALMQLADFATSEDEAYKILTYTMANGWKSFQKPKQEKNGNGKFSSNGKQPIDHSDYERNLARRMADAASESGHTAQ